MQIAIFFKIKVLEMNLSNVLMSVLEILEFAKAADCYSTVSIAY